MASEYTPNYNLDLYVSTDKPNLRDQYNAAMGKIDAQMKANADNLTSANNNISTLQTVQGQHATAIAELQDRQNTTSETVETLQTAVSKNTSDISTLQTSVSKNTSDISTLQTSVGSNTSDIESLKPLAGQVSSLQTEVSGKAPTNHASTSATYGLGTASSYGHVRLSDVANDSQNVSDGVGVTPYALYRLWQYLQLSTPTKVFDSNLSASDLNTLNMKTGSLTAAPTGFDAGSAVIYAQHNSDYSIVRVYGRITANPSSSAQVPAGTDLVFVVPGIKLPNSTFRTVNYTGQYSYSTSSSETNFPNATSSYLLADGRFALGILSATSATEVTFSRAYYWQMDIVVNPLNW